MDCDDYANKAGRAALENWKTTIGQPAPEFWCTKVIEALENQSQQIIEVSIGARVISFVIIPIIGEGYVNLYGRDITESKRAEDALKKSEEKFREIFNSVNDAIYLFRLGKGDIPDKLTEVNDVACKMLGYSKEEFLELSPADFSVGGIGEKLQESITQLLSQGQMIVESLHRTKDGKIIPVEISSRLVEIMGETKILSVARDITERQRMKDALSDSEEQFRATFEQAAVGIAQVGLDGRWLRVNQRLCDIVGYTGEELLPLTFQDITHPDDLNIDLDYVRQILAGKIQTYSMEKRYIRKDRSMVWVNLTVGLVRDEAAAPKYFISVVEDITKRKQAEEVLKESEKRFSTAFFTSPVSQSIIAQGSNEIMEVNDACCRLFEYSREELIGASTAKLNLWEIPADRLSALEELQKTGQLLRQEATIRVKSGGIHTIIVAIEPISFKGIPCLISSLFDITERKQAEHALQHARDDLEIQVQKRTAALAESNTLLQMLLDNSPDHIFF